MTSRPRKSAAITQFIYSGSALIAVIEPVKRDSWRVILRGKEVGVFSTREEAVAAVFDDERA